MSGNSDFSGLGRCLGTKRITLDGYAGGAGTSVDVFPKTDSNGQRAVVSSFVVLGAPGTYFIWNMSGDNTDPFDEAGYADQVGDVPLVLDGSNLGNFRIATNDQAGTEVVVVYFG